MLILFLFCVHLSAQQIGSAYSTYECEIITREEIQSGGILRLSDIFFQIGASEVKTIDGYRIQTNINLLNPGWDQNWILMVDGQRIDLDYPYMKNINLLPFDLSEVDYIEVFTLPQISSGEYSDKGMIHIHTVKPADGLSIHVSTSSASEIGDPGPFKYTDTNTPNIDQIGPYYSASISLGSEKLSLRMGVKHHMQIYSDPLIRKRMANYAWENKEMKLLGAYAKVEVDLLNGKHILFAAHAHTGDPLFYSVYGSDLLFFNPYGAEIPVDPIFNHVGLSGYFNLTPSASINYQFKFSSSLLDFPMYYQKPAFDWNINNYNGYVEFENRKSDSEGLVGFGINHVKFVTGYQLFGNSFTLFRIYGKYKKNYFDIISQTYFGSFVFDGTKTAVKAGVNSQIKMSKEVSFLTGISFSNRLPEEDNNLWYWSMKGYGFLNSYGLNYSIEDELSISKQFIAEAELHFDAGERFSFAFGGFFRLYSNQNIEHHNYIIDPATYLFDTETVVGSNQNGSVFGPKFTFDQQISSSFHHKIYYRYIPIIDGTDEFYDVMLTFPAHKFVYTISYQPVSSFSLNTMFTYLSESFWPEYNSINTDSSNLYSNNLKERLLIDLAAQKFFWHNRLRVSILLKNILGKEDKYHPIGGIFDMTLFLQVELILDSIL
ncbi:MAG: hypothetical protein A2V66_14625 [Ignavibacteria bacterium RBG_13_36_8]|nr:MAG: hypothetical protein A2V66_14625 [Ignavibacteria bacterium RBG_13_36_8]